MRDPGPRGEPFFFYLTPPVVLRLIPLAVLAFIMLQVFYGGYTVGSARLSSGFHNNPELWWLLAFLIGFTAIMLRLAFPPKRTQARLEIRHHSISFVPRRIDQRMGGASVTEAAVTAQSTEILFCHKLLEGIPEGFSFVIRGNHEHEARFR
jgi:heme A synthase